MLKSDIKRAKKLLYIPISLSLLLVGSVLVIGGLMTGHHPVEAAEVVVYKSPTCGCCSKWINHLRENGFSVDVYNRQDMGPVKAGLGVPRHLQSCHTATVGDYIVEGHVPADDIVRLLKEKPAVKGLTVPGMPMGSPGMEGPRSDPYDVLSFQKNGKTAVYASRNQ